MEERKFEEENAYLFSSSDVAMRIDEENHLSFGDVEQQVNDDVDVKSSYGDSGFDDLVPQSFLDEHKPLENPLLKGNAVFHRLFSDSNENTNSKFEQTQELDAQAQDVLEFFNKGTTLSRKKNR